MSERRQGLWTRLREHYERRVAVLEAKTGRDRSEVLLDACKENLRWLRAREQAEPGM